MSEVQTNQKILDILETSKLIADNGKETQKQLDKVDKNINNTGKTVVDLHETTKQVSEKVNQQTELLEKVNKNQEDVQDSNVKLTDVINETLGVFNDNSETLNTVNKKLDQNRQLRETNHQELLSKLDTSNGEYANNVIKLLDKMDETKDTLASLNAKKDVSKLFANVNEVKEGIGKLKATNEANEKVLTEQLAQVTEQFNTVIEKIQESTKRLDDMSEAHQTAIARMHNIELMMEAMSDSQESPEE